MLDPITTAVLVLLACSPDARQCHEMRLPEAYATIEACRAALPDTLRRMSHEGQPAIGRCVSHEGDAGVDPIVTGAVEPGLATVRVTRIE
ncbi:hypothetical protein, partial [Mesorhizobium sp. KR9-304]|uniref:hypothetical protein n=1 Tax=Mesorhizobium sp. KR9-304 TaxID=3156614 RepID=UPI0032B4F22B